MNSATAVSNIDRGLTPNWSSTQVGFAAFLCSEAAFFATLIVAYLTYLGKSNVGPYPQDVLSLPLVFCNSVLLLSSSVTIAIAMSKFHRNQNTQFNIWMSMTIALGLAFLAGTAYEWYQLIFIEGLTISRNLFGTTFFVLIGFHATHVSIGILMMLTLLLLNIRMLRPSTAEGAELISWYWHFVDAVWVVVFLVVYVFGR